MNTATHNAVQEVKPRPPKYMWVVEGEAEDREKKVRVRQHVEAYFFEQAVESACRLWSGMTVTKVARGKKL
jgi:hypothetical protein